MGFYPGDEGGNIAGDIEDEDIIGDIDISQGWGVDHLGQVDVRPPHALHLGDVAVVDKGGQAGHLSLAGGRAVFK